MCMLGQCLFCSEPADLPVLTLHSIDSEHDSNSEDSLSDSSCDSEDEKCKTVTYSKWGKEDGNVSKMQITVDLEDANDLWKQAIPKLKSHIYRKRKQVMALESAKRNLSRDEILIHCDFSQSYKNNEQDEIQSAYFGYESFSLFTSCVYYKDKDDELKTMPITVTTEGNEHSRQTSFSCLQKVIEHVQERLGVSLSNIIIWSDGCCSQFRSRFVAYFLANFQLDVNIEWNYSEAHHGKGPMDGIGGTVKNIVFKEVKSGRLSVDTPEEFATAANRLCKVHSLYLPLENYIDEPDGIKEAPEIKGILQVHRIVRKFNHQNVPYLDFYELSLSEEIYYRQFYRSDDDPDVCGHIVIECDENHCAHCTLKYKRNEAWSQCQFCSYWFHDSCYNKLM